MERFTDYYSVLGIGQKATVTEIKIAFKKKSLIWHPDQNIGFDTTKKMQEVNEAYQILSNEKLKFKYDKRYENCKREQAKEERDRNTANIHSTTQKTKVNGKVLDYICDTKSDKELVRICKHAVKYPLEYLNLVTAELKKRFNNQSLKDILRKFNLL